MNEQYERRDSGLMVPKAQELLVGGKYVGQIIRNGKVVDEMIGLQPREVLAEKIKGLINQ